MVQVAFPGKIMIEMSKKKYISSVPIVIWHVKVLKKRTTLERIFLYTPMFLYYFISDSPPSENFLQKLL